MAHALRYYKEITHADGKVIRIEFHEKNGTAPAMELGSVIQSLNLEIQGGDDIDTPIIKTQLNFTLVDAPDHAEAKTKKCGNWEEFYSPDATHWKVLLFEVVDGEKMPIWGGYITPDSYREVLMYRSGVSFIARDNIGHMQDFPFDAKGNDDGMITLMGVLTSAWAKIESPMRLNFTSSGADWLRCEDTLALDTYMNVSAFEGKNWYEVINDILFSYGLVMRFTGNAEVSVFPLRYMPTEQGLHGELVPMFETGAERELSPAVRRIEESVDYELVSDIPAKPLKSENFTNTADRYSYENGGVAIETGLVHPIFNTDIYKGWANQNDSTLFFDVSRMDLTNFTKVQPYADDIKKYMYIAVNNKTTASFTIERSVSYGHTMRAQDFSYVLNLGMLIEESGTGKVAKVDGYSLVGITYAVSIRQNGITQYYAGNGKWQTEFVELTQEVLSGEGSNSFRLSVDVAGQGGEQSADFVLYIRRISYECVGKQATGNGLYAAIHSLCISAPSSILLLEKNRVNTLANDSNNVILSREPKIAPALNATPLAKMIKNGIFVKVGYLYNPAKLWSWNGNGKQQMAVYNHLQLLCYYGKPNNILSGTIVNADVANFTKLYKWNNTEHIITSGVLNLISGYIENATLREFVRYEDMWGDLTDTADFPEVEGSSKTTADSGTSSQTTTYSNTTNVTIGGGSGTIVLDTFMSDSSTNGVQNRIIKAYVDSSVDEVQDKVTSLESAIGNKADKNNVYTKEQIDGKLTGIATDIDNLEDSKASNIKVNAIDDRLKEEEDVTKTYSAWWKDLMTYVKVVGGNVVIDTNLLVEGESATRGVGDPSTGGGIDLNALEKYLDEYNYINEDDLREYGFATEQDVNNAIDALNIGDYAKTSEVERLFTALNIGQYAKTADVNAALGNKVDKVSGKGLSTNDFTDALLTRLNGIAEGAQVNVQSDWNATSGDAFIKNKPTLGALAAKDNVAYSEVTGTPNLVSVATSGKYSDLSGTPDLSVYALTDDVERLFTALNISQYAKTSELGDLAFVDSLSKSDVGLGNVANETYAGGTAVTLNGFSKAKSTASFYAPTSAGTVGYFLKSQGAGDAPIWSALGALATKDSLTYSDVGVTKDVITSLIGTTTYAAYNANGYLPLNGGTLTSKNWGTTLTLKGDSTSAGLQFYNNGSFSGILYSNNDGPVWYKNSSAVYPLIHSGNIESQSVDSAKGLIFNGIVTDLNPLGRNGVYAFNTSTSNKPVNYGVLFQMSNKDTPSATDGSSWIYQIAGSTAETALYTRFTVNGGAWSAWKTIAFTDSDFKLGLGHSITDSNDRSALSISADNQINIGYGTAGANFNTNIHGASIILKYGTSRSWGMVMNTSGNVTIGASDLASTNYKLYVGGNVAFGTASGCDVWLKRTTGYNYINVAHSLAFTVNNDAANIAATFGSDKKASFYGAVTMSSTLSVATSVQTITVKSAGTYLDFAANGATVAGCRLTLVANAFRPWSTDADLIDLGATNARWRGLYCGTGNFSGAVTISGQTTINNNLIVTGDVAVA